VETIFRSGLFQDEVAIVTGGATGIGFATALELGKLGAKLAICGRRPEVLDEGAAKLKAAGVEVFHQPCDIRDGEKVSAFVGAVKARFGRIDLLVNNAGGQFPSMAEGLSAKGFEAVVRNNLFGTWNFVSTVAKEAFIPQKRGRAVNIIANIARGFPGMVHTGAARAGVENLTKTLAVEWAPHGIRINAVAPGVIRTPGTDQYPPELMVKALRLPLRRLGTAEEVAEMVAYLLTKAADYVTGQTFYIDGGQSLWGDIWELDENVPDYTPK
jgi:citronellol/citronellal dehydrogenase